MKGRRLRIKSISVSDKDRLRVFSEHRHPYCDEFRNAGGSMVHEGVLVVRSNEGVTTRCYAPGSWTWFERPGTEICENAEIGASLETGEETELVLVSERIAVHDIHEAAYGLLMNQDTMAAGDYAVACIEALERIVVLCGGSIAEDGLLEPADLRRGGKRP